MGQALSDLSLQAEEHALLEARFVAHHEPQRTWPFYAITMVLCFGLWAVSWVPAFERGFGVSSREMAVVAGAIALAITVATLAARFAGGVLGAAYKLAEPLETAVLAGCSASLIYLSGSASSIFWLITVLLLLHNSPDALSAPLLRGAHAVALAAVAALFMVDGRVADAVVVAFFGVVLFFLARTQEQTGRRFLRLQAERDALRRQVEELIVEKERERIARDLHDGLGAQLAALAWRADALVLDGEAGEGSLSALSEHARAGLRELRQLIQGLDVQPMRVPELAQAIARDAATLVPARCTFGVEQRGDAQLSGQQCFHLGLMIREAVRNAIQHGGARAITVKLEASGGRGLLVQVADDGSGVSQASIEHSRGGLRHLRERASVLGAELDIVGSSTGTTVRIHVPL
jgi:signal transduction histidine kinase